MNRENKKQKLRKMLAQMEMSCDQLWRYVQEDEILEKIDELRREEYIEKEKPTDKDILVCMCATLVFSEALKRRSEKEREL